MGTAQMLMVVVAMFLLGIIIFSANSTLADNDIVIKNSEFGVAAISLATSLIEEVEGKVFDEAANDSGVTKLANLTLPAYFGPDANESYRTTDSTMSDFDDLDDFDGFSIEYVSDPSRPQIATYRGDSKGFRADYLVKAKVVYVNAGGGVADLNSFSASPTWHKKLIVTVTSPSSRDTLVFPTIISYWN